MRARGPPGHPRFLEFQNRALIWRLAPFRGLSCPPIGGHRVALTTLCSGPISKATPPTMLKLLAAPSPRVRDRHHGTIPLNEEADKSETIHAVAGNSDAVTVELRPVSELVPYDRNSRIHSDEAVARLVRIIRDMGWTSPILTDGHGIVAGHKRRLAALAIYDDGGTIRLPGGNVLPIGMVPVIDVSGWTEAQRRAYVIADNQTTLESEWDGEALRLELSWLSDQDGFDMDLTGFTGETLDAALGALAQEEGQGQPEPDPLRVSLADRFGVPPFSVLSAREGWWQDRKRAWLRLGIMSELGRGEDSINEAAPGGSARPLDRRRAAKASPGGSPRPATNYGQTKARGDGRGREV